MSTAAAAVLPIEHVVEPFKPTVISSHRPQMNDCALIGQSPAFLRAMSIATRIARTDCSVEISGETGTGKEGLARFIHQMSNRSGRPYVPLNCAGVPKELIESVLFGHVRGAFTSANEDRTGLVAKAEKGTLFLDEIGEMSLDLQPKLLRLLEERTYRKVGMVDETRADIRLIAAGNKNLDVLVSQGQFRPDLYHRLSVINITLPPLRDRKDDIPLLANHFLNKFRNEHKRDFNGFAEPAMRKLVMFSWPGNIRQLRNVVERAVLISDNDTISASDINFGELHPEENVSPLKLPPSGYDLEELEREALTQALQYASGSQVDAAKLLGISSRVMNYKVRRLFKIDPTDFRPRRIA